jgi:hypothetical protein
MALMNSGINMGDDDKDNLFCYLEKSYTFIWNKYLKQIQELKIRKYK